MISFNIKKLLLLLIIPLLFSCNKKITLCDCTDIILEAYFTPVRIDEDLGVILREKYGNKIDACEKIFEPFVKDEKLIEEKIYKECEGFEEHFNDLIELYEKGEPTGYERHGNETRYEIGNVSREADLITFDMEEIEMVAEGKPIPPPPPPEIEVVEYEIENEEEIKWEDVELEENEEIEIEEEVVEVDIVDFAIVESIPLFPGCEKSSASDYNMRRQEDLQCFNAGIMNHIKDKFKYPEIAKEMGISEKIYVQFIIDKTGRIKDAKVVRGDNKYLKEEALRLVKGIPKMTPASQRNKPVGVPYTIPIHFKLQ